MRIEALARFPLAQLPTPIEELKSLSRELGGSELLIKRDDQTGLALGGNKTRKLEFLVRQALEQGADTARDDTRKTTIGRLSRQGRVFGVRWEAQRHTAFFCEKVSARKAPSSLRFADAVQNAARHPR